MIVQKHLDPRIIARIAWKRVLTLTVLSGLVFLAYGRFGNRELAISTLPASILGIAIAFLIGFRVNAAYERWWEGRKVWGTLVNESRTLARQLDTLLSVAPGGAAAEGAAGDRTALIRGQLGFVNALRRSLRGQDLAEPLRAYFPPDEARQLAERRNVPNAILQRQARKVRSAIGDGQGGLAHLELSRTLDRLGDAMGAAERIKGTVFPRQYGYYSSVFTMLYSYLLPFILVQECGWMMVPFTVLIGFIFFSLDNIAAGIEDPFSNTVNDVPMDALCRSIEIDLLQMSGDGEVPQAIQATHGLLM